MIPLSEAILQGCDWKNALAQAVRDPAELLEFLELPDTLLPDAKKAAERFPLRVPYSYLKKIRKRDPDDPLLRQILPLGIELEESPGYSDDPVGDLAAQTTPGLLHKYHGRALMVTTGACAIHCRYCFRRNYPYTQSNPLQGNHPGFIDYIRKNPDINEIILSGGDPLSLSDERLIELVNSLEQLPQLNILRIHTRMPIVLPERINLDLISWLQSTQFRTVVVTHVNHANELDKEVSLAMEKLVNAGVTLLNQSVLLRQVNDNKDALIQLSYALFNAHILPYYLHQLDKVRGASHFAVTDDIAIALQESMRRELPGYLTPRLVRELPGQASKLPML